MKRLLLPALLLITGCATAPKDTVMQVSTIDALLAGVYDGQFTLGELKKHGDLGIGTFDALEGEMIVIDGTVYQAKVDGKLYRLPDSATTPFAAMVNFTADQSATLDAPLAQDALKAHIDTLAPNKNLFLAVRINGTFSHIKFRSVPEQNKPYPPLAEAAKHQAAFEHTNIKGTVLGFRSPAYVKGIGVPDYHLHFISTDRKTGGHVLDLTLKAGKLQLDTCSKFYMALTDNEHFGSIDLSKDRSHELERVEK